MELDADAGADSSSPDESSLDSSFSGLVADSLSCAKSSGVKITGRDVTGRIEVTGRDWTADAAEEDMCDSGRVAANDGPRLGSNTVLFAGA